MIKNGREIYVPDGHPASWYVDAEEAFAKAHELEEYATHPYLVNPLDVIKEANRILEIAITMSSS